MSDEESDEDEEPSATVIDCGSLTTRCGPGGEEQPKTRIDSMVVDDHDAECWPMQNGHPADWDACEKLWEKAFRSVGVNVSHESNETPGVLMGLSAAQEFVCGQRPGDRYMEYVRLMFEDMDVGRCYLDMNTCLGLYASGRTTGIVADVGHGQCHTGVFYEGFRMGHGDQFLDRTGQDLTTYAEELCGKGIGGREVARNIKESLCYSSLDYESELAGSRSSPGYIRASYLLAVQMALHPRLGAASSMHVLPPRLMQLLTNEIKQNWPSEWPAEGPEVWPLSQRFRLPDGAEVTVGDALIRVPERLMSHSTDSPDRPEKVSPRGHLPSTATADRHSASTDTLPEAIIKAYLACDVDVRTDLIRSVVCVGGSTMFPNFKERLQIELDSALRKQGGVAPDVDSTNSSIRAKIVATPERKYQSWLGGSILSSLSTFPSMWIPRNNAIGTENDAYTRHGSYDEVGPSIVMRACNNL
jgi:actin-related protein